MDREGLRKVADALGYEPATVRRQEIKGIHTYTPKDGFKVNGKHPVHLLDQLASRRGFNRVRDAIPEWRVNKRPTTIGDNTGLEGRPLIQNGTRLRVEKSNPDKTATKQDNIVTTVDADIVRLQTRRNRLGQTRTYAIFILDED